MKKSIILVLVALICLSAVFAADNSVKVSAVPVGFQISTSSADGAAAVKSRYGLGLEAAYQRTLVKGLYAEAGLAWHTFLMKDNKPAFTNLLVFAGMGYKYAFNDKWAGSASLDLGADTLFYNGKVSETFTLVTGLDASYAVKDNLEVLFGLKGSFGFAKKDSVKYVNYRILPVLGVSVNF